MTALVMHPAPAVGTFHAAGDSKSYRFANRSLNWLAGRLDLRVAVSDDARELAERYFGGTYDVLFNGVELERYRHVRPIPRTGPTVMFCGRHEPRKGLEVLLNALAELSERPERDLLNECVVARQVDLVQPNAHRGLLRCDGR